MRLLFSAACLVAACTALARASYDADDARCLEEAYAGLTEAERCGVPASSLVSAMHVEGRRGLGSVPWPVSGAEQCGAGTYATPNPQGGVANVTSPYVCQLCPEDTYQPLAGQPNCTACPAGHSTQWQRGVKSSAQCLCALGYYAKERKCVACPQNAICPGQNIPPYAQEGFYTFKGQVVLPCYFTTCLRGDSASRSRCGEFSSGVLCSQCDSGLALALILALIHTLTQATFGTAKRARSARRDRWGHSIART